MNALINKLKQSGISNAEQEYVWLQQNASSEDQLAQWIDDRVRGKPIAYIIGHVDFYGLNLIVNEHVLIPRFETEQLIELVLNDLSHRRTYNILDLGCGSGAIALAIKKQLPKCNVFGIDYSKKALGVALKNQAKYPNNNVYWIQSNWLGAINLDNIDVIITNPPYVETNWNDPSIAFEPPEALFSGKDGLNDIKKIINACKDYPHLNIWFEHGHQHDLAKLVGSPWNITQHFDHSGTQRFSQINSPTK